MPFLEEGEGKADQVTEQARAEGEVQRVLNDDDDQRSEPGHRDVQRPNKGKAERQDHQQIDIASGDHLVDGQLQIERSCQDENFERHREREKLEQRVLGSVACLRNVNRRSLDRSSLRSKPEVGVSSSATPVKCFDASLDDMRFSPSAGSCRTTPFFPTDLRTTKWFISQCRMAGSFSSRRSSDLEPDRPRGEIEVSRDLDQRPEGDSVQREQMLAS